METPKTNCFSLNNPLSYNYHTFIIQLSYNYHIIIIQSIGLYRIIHKFSWFKNATWQLSLGPRSVPWRASDRTRKAWPICALQMPWEIPAAWQILRCGFNGNGEWGIGFSMDFFYEWNVNGIRVYSNGM